MADENHIGAGSGSTPPNTRSSYKRWTIGFLLIAALLAGVYLFRDRLGGSQQTGAGRRSGAGAQVVPVLTAKAQTGEINEYLTGLGTVTPLATANVKTRVDGQVMKVLYREGQMVRARGDLRRHVSVRLQLGQSLSDGSHHRHRLRRR
jgi:membrane fusion protein, multidrug efflux system